MWRITFFVSTSQVAQPTSLASGKSLPALASDAENEDGFLTALMPCLAAHHVMLSDTLDLSTPQARDNVLDLLRAAAHAKTAEVTWIHIRYLLSEATESELNTLMLPENLPFVRGLVNDVLDDLDERAVTERTALRAELPEAVGHLLLNE